MLVFSLNLFFQYPINSYMIDIDASRNRYLYNLSFEDYISPYIVYQNQDNNYTDRFFDTFIFADLSFYNNEYLTTMYWWEDFIDRLFTINSKRSPWIIESGYKSKKAVCLNVKESCIYTILTNVHSFTLSFMVKSIGETISAGYVGFRPYPLDTQQNYIDYGFIWSDYLQIWYRYFNADSTWQHYTFDINFPYPYDSLILCLGKWKSSILFLDKVDITGPEVQLEGDYEQTSCGWNFTVDPAKDEPIIHNYLLRLDDLIGEYLNLTHSQDSRVNVVIMIPLTHLSFTDHFFGKIDEKNTYLSEESDVNTIVKWYIDECIDRWEKVRPDHLTLLGFYWLNEEGNDSLHIDLKNIADFVHNRGYNILGSAYNKYWMTPSLSSNYFSIFDYIFMQPNVWPANYKKDARFFEYVQRSFKMGGLRKDSVYVKKWGIPIDEITEIQLLVDSLNTGVVIEWVPGQEDVFYYGRVLDYCNNNKKLEHSFLGKNILVYDNGGFGQYCNRSNNYIYREQYEEVYNFIRINRTLKMD